jgi:hypothetical protein
VKSNNRKSFASLATSKLPQKRLTINRIFHGLPNFFLTIDVTRQKNHLKYIFLGGEANDDKWEIDADFWFF